jgi:DNA-binding transcriptional LysR family regulator
VTVERLMKEVEEAARRDRRDRLVAGGAAGYSDPELFAEVDEVLRRAVERSNGTVLLPEVLPDDEEWRLDTSLRFSSHRPLIGPAIVFVKQRLLLPLVRWLVDYNRDNFRRQQRVNRLLAACIEELAIENARLRRELNRR